MHFRTHIEARRSMHRDYFNYDLAFTPVPLAGQSYDSLYGISQILDRGSCSTTRFTFVALVEKS